MKEIKDFFEKLEKKDIILIFVILVFILVVLILYLVKLLNANTNNNVEKTSDNNNTITYTVPQTEEEIIQDLSTKGERDRMEYYCGQYFKHLQMKEYEAAYNLLYAEFKERYFPTLEEYIEYINKTYPDTYALEYNDITRQGYIYVLDLNILDIFGEQDKKSQRIVLKENTYNNFVLSFQVI